MKSDRFGLTEQTMGRIAEVLARHLSVQQAVLYGSRAKGTHRRGSDIDLTLTGPKLEVSELLQLVGELDDLLLPYTIDLSLHHMLTQPDLLDHIRRVGVVIYEHPATD